VPTNSTSSGPDTHVKLRGPRSIPRTPSAAAATSVAKGSRATIEIANNGRTPGVLVNVVAAPEPVRP
jgi:hypothetical protein